MSVTRRQRPAHNDLDGCHQRTDLELWRVQPVERRTFLSLLTLVSASLSCGACGVRQVFDRHAEAPLADDGEPRAEWLTIAAVQNHLLPADGDGPGAEDSNAIGYLRLIMADPGFDSDEKNFIFNGVGWLDELAQTSHQKAFVALDSAGREAMLRRIARTRAGENWLATLLRYLFEALLSDPIYGGNPDQIGWRWLEHQPGFPRPTADKVYFRLS